MASISIPAVSLELPVNPGISILNILLRNDVKIMHKCGGKMQCGTCRIRIIRGSEFLSPLKEEEKKRLEAVNAGINDRLACQTYAFGDIEIKINPEPDI